MTTASPAPLPSASSQEALHALLREVLPRQGAWSDEEYLWLPGCLTRPSRSRRRTNGIRGTGPGRYYGSSSSSRSLKTVRWFRTVRRR